MLALLLKLCPLDIDVGSVVAGAYVYSTLMLALLLLVHMCTEH